VLNFTVIDGLSKLFQLLVRLADKEATNMNARVNLLSRVLNEAKKQSKQPFDQRPYYRLLSNLLHDLGVPDAKQELNLALFPMLAAYTQVYLVLQPATVPGFAYSWIQLVSRRTFMPHLLLSKGQKSWPYLHRLLSLSCCSCSPF
jgi:CCR4-NOT transcription complex subunit 1